MLYPKFLQNWLAYNLCFSWKGEIADIFQRIDTGLWAECRQNPVLMLGLVSQERLDELAEDQGFLAQLERLNQDFDRYLSQPRIQAEDYYPEMPFQVAYFSAEFGLSECLPIYSGGLGILAGDHLKSASDLNVPLVGVGLLYQKAPMAGRWRLIRSTTLQTCRLYSSGIRKADLSAYR